MQDLEINRCRQKKIIYREWAIAQGQSGGLGGQVQVVPWLHVHMYNSERSQILNMNLTFQIINKVGG